MLSKIQKPFVESGKKRNYYLTYTILFLVLAFFCFSWFIFSGKSLIWQDDGWNQHFKALVYYAQYLRKIVRTLLFEHRLVIPDWDFNIGEGSDIVNALHYYVIGDPIALFSVFVPTRNMHYFFSASCILRLYLSGISFSALCFGTGQKNRYGIMAGALSYSFCMWGFTCAARHPYFLNPMIYFPLMILGIEKIIKREKPYLFIFTVAISASSNFYFFYMIVLLTIAYALIRLGLIYKTRFRKGALTLVRLGCYAIIGVMMAGMILLPVLMMFLQDSRLSVSQPFHWLYPLTYYSQLPGVVISTKQPYWLNLGLTAPVILAVFTVFMDIKKHLLLKILFAVCTAIVLFPIGGRILNGMSYMTNRWCWAFVLLCTYILTCEWENLLMVSKKRWLLLLICSVGFYGICLLFDQSRSAAVFSAISLLFLSLIVMDEKIVGDNTRALLLVLVIMIGVINNAFWKYSPGAGNYVKEFVENRKVWEEWNNNEFAAVKSISGDSFSRYSGRFITSNANAINEISNTQYYWTISNPYVNNYRSALAMREPTYFNFDGYDDRTTPNALAAVQYYTVENYDNAGMPYGYEKISTINTETTQALWLENLRQELQVEELTDAQVKKISDAMTNNITLYRNQYALPIGYCYDAFIPDTEWQDLNPVQKQESLLDAACVDTVFEELPKYEDATVHDYIVPYEIECIGNDITQIDSGFITTAGGTQIVLTLYTESENAETYIGFEGLEFSPTPKYDLYFGDETVDPLNLYNKTNWEMLSRDSQISIRKSKFYMDPVVNVNITAESSEGAGKSIHYKQPDASFSSGRHDFIANLGYTEEAVSTVTITFPERGIYSFDDLLIYRIPMDGYAEKIARLQENTLQNVQFEVDGLRGDIEVDSSKLLCIAIPYSAGWTGYINGEEAEVYCVNEHYLGLLVPEGKNTIYLHYKMPYKKEGVVISMLGIAALCMVFLFEQKKRSRRSS